jgi:ElaB/YqjD/DUF883 family membrane-anchored ribosome-binding protein
MDHEPEEVIKHQMLETRAALAEKLETLEQQVVGTVHSATTAVADTVESVKDAVQQTVEMARESVHDTVEAVKDTFDLSRHVREHPWMMVSGSIAAGYVGGCLLPRLAAAASDRLPSGGVPSLSSLAALSRVERNGGAGQRIGEETPATSTASGPAAHGLLGGLEQRFGPELHKLKGLALGTMLGVVRDMIASAAPPQLGSQLAEIVDSATVKLGGQPIHGPVLNMFQQDPAERQEAQQRVYSTTGSMGRTQGLGSAR